MRRRSGREGPAPVALATALLVALAALGAAAPGPTGAQAPGDISTDPLADVYADVTVIADPPESAPRALALRDGRVDGTLLVEPRGRGEAVTAATLDVVLLERGTRRWATLDVATLPPPLHTGSGLPWLVPVDPPAGRFVVVRSSGPERRSTVTTLTVRGSSVLVGPTTEIRMATDAAAGADVDGDGDPELVLASAATRRGDGACQDTRILVLDPVTRALITRLVIQGTRLGGATLAEVDGQPGADLVAHVYRNCPAGPLVETGGRLRALRLADGASIAELTAEGGTAVAGAAGLPFAFDLDGDGLDELAARLGGRTVLVDPSRGWTVADIGPTRPLLLAAEGSAGSAWLAAIEDPGATGRTPSILFGALRRSDASGQLMLRDEVRLTAPTSGSEQAARWELASRVGLYESIRATLPGGWVGDLDGDGCTDLIVLLAQSICPSADHRDASRGPLWLATRPVLAFDSMHGRRLLVAAAVDWDPITAGLASPTPADAWSMVGGWRAGPSGRFILQEVETDLPAPDPGRGLFVLPVSPAVEPRARVLGRTGDRLLARVTPGVAGAGAAAASPMDEPFSAVDVQGFLVGSRGGEQVLLAAIGQPVEGHRSEGSVRIPLPLEIGEQEGDLPATSAASPELDQLAGLGADALSTGAAGWLLRVMAVDPLGEVAGPAARVVGIDSVAPLVAVEVPLLSAPWPFRTALDGRTEPNARILLGAPDGSPVAADADGRFTVPVTLAPWPQTIAVQAFDEAGNETIKHVSVVGGLDYRQLPWHLALIAVVFLGLGLSAWRITRSGSVGPLAPGTALARGRDATDSGAREMGRVALPIRAPEGPAAKARGRAARGGRPDRGPDPRRSGASAPGGQGGGDWVDAWVLPVIEDLPGPEHGSAEGWSAGFHWTGSLDRLPVTRRPA